MCVHGYVQNIYTVFTQWVDKELIAIGEKAKKNVWKATERAFKIVDRSPVERIAAIVVFVFKKKLYRKQRSNIFTSFHTQPNPLILSIPKSFYSHLSLSI